ncbi:MAG: hypothetical protein JXR66_09190 [Bacteroidales bacterium]|nr:hypothetical protein [Bacteroidales bacterium]MBN2633718.1 hypothetical protein [Bacteroidales bacterium]
MNRFLKIFKISAVILSVLLALLFMASLAMQDKVAGIILRSLGKNISTRYEFKNIKLSFIRKFPRASLEMKDVIVYSSPGYDISAFKEFNTDTLLTAGSVSADFKLTAFLKGVYTIENISVREGRLNLFTDSTGKVNYNFYVKDSERDSSSGFTIDLQRINISDIWVTYNNLATRLLIKGVVGDGRLKSRFSSADIDFSAEGSMRIDLFRLYNFVINKSIEAKPSLRLSTSGNLITFSRSILELDNYVLGLEGTISRENVYDLTITGENIDLAMIAGYLPGRYREDIEDYDPSGILNINTRIYGPASRTVNPGLEVSFDLSDGNIRYKKSPLVLSDLSLKGSFTNGSGRIPATSSLSVSGFSAALGSSQYQGSLLLNDFDRMYCKLSLKGKVIPAEIKEFFDLKQVSQAGGSVDMDLSLEGPLDTEGKIKAGELLTMHPGAELRFSSFSLGLNENSLLFGDVNGLLKIADTSVASGLSFTFRDHLIKLDGSFINFPGWLAGEQVMLSGYADLGFDSLEPEKLFATGKKSGTETAIAQRSVKFPESVILDLDLRADQLKYKTFSASGISGKFSYAPGILNFKTLVFSALEGNMSGDGFVVQNKDKTHIGRGSFQLESIDVNKTFTSFNNFGQDFIVAENLAGTLSGSLSVLLPMDSLLKPQVKSVTAEGKYLLLSGSLIDFDPVKELSKFVELSELQNINFDKLENDFFIRNNYFYLPQMEVKSSAANLSVNGKHGFGNDFEYHVKILLSEALSKKIRKPKPNTTEFGAVQEDGLGRTSLLLKIASKGDDVKVSYDLKAAGTQVKNEIKSERKSLRTILNEEYGWYGNDTTLTRTKQSPARKFRISWEEIDTVKLNNY